MGYGWGDKCCATEELSGGQSTLERARVLDHQCESTRTTHVADDAELFRICHEPSLDALAFSFMQSTEK